MALYRTEIDLPLASLPMNEVIETVQEVASAKLLIEIEAEDLWELKERCHEIEIGIEEHYGGNFSIPKPTEVKP